MIPCGAGADGHRDSRYPTRTTHLRRTHNHIVPLLHRLVTVFPQAKRLTAPMKKDAASIDSILTVGPRRSNRYDAARGQALSDVSLGISEAGRQPSSAQTIGSYPTDCGFRIADTLGPASGIAWPGHMRPETDHRASRLPLKPLSLMRHAAQPQHGLAAIQIHLYHPTVLPVGSDHGRSMSCLSCTHIKASPARRPRASVSVPTIPRMQCRSEELRWP